MKKEFAITEFLLEHANKQTISFHMPGHKGSAFYRRFGYGEFLNKIMDCDITEIPGGDNLFQAEGIIKSVQDKYKELYEVPNSYLLINGTSGGIIASILASVAPGGKLIMARNCHKSVFNALSLGNIQPVYAYPQLIMPQAISGEISPEEIEKCILENPDAGAIILPSPNYYGICSDIKAIANLAHKHGKVLIVDQAHGAHLKFFKEGMPPAAEDSGADITINSIHKTLASFTQSAVLNLNSSIVDPYSLEDKLQSIQSTSPSYLLMASLDINASILLSYGDEIMDRWAQNLSNFYDTIADFNNSGNYRPVEVLSNLDNFDRSKINIDTGNLGMTAEELENLLMKENIFSELTTGNILMLMTGIGNSAEDYQMLAAALKKIAKESQSRVPSPPPAPVHLTKRTKIFEIPTDKIRIPLAESAGYICASSIIPYPPGIPLVCPGEKLEPDTIDYIQSLRKSGQKVIGVNNRGEVSVGSP